LVSYPHSEYIMFHFITFAVFLG